MREILFRGKRDYNGEWVEGSLLAWPDGSTEMCYPNPKDGDELLKVIVWPETVGQFTGVTDKNGTKIFEGDILQYYDDEIQVVEWSDEWPRTMLHTYGERERKAGRKTVKEMHEGWNDLDDYPLNEMPILGNIHDNPELIERWRK